MDFSLPGNLRLGHMVERIVSELIKRSENYRLLHENVQLFDGKQTIGEIDFILKELTTGKLLHMEFAYKFYLFDPDISSEIIKNWIGPNRKDSLVEKLEKLAQRQFPLLFHDALKSALWELSPKDIHQAACILSSLYVPYQCRLDFDPAYKDSIRGYYLNLDAFSALHDPRKRYYIPVKLQWGMDPSSNKNWEDFASTKRVLQQCMMEKQAQLCWQNQEGAYSQFFVVWW